MATSDTDKNTVTLAVFLETVFRVTVPTGTSMKDLEAAARQRLRDLLDDPAWSPTFVEDGADDDEVDGALVCATCGASDGRYHDPGCSFHSGN